LHSGLLEEVEGGQVEAMQGMWQAGQEKHQGSLLKRVSLQGGQEADMDALQELREGADPAAEEWLVQRGMFDGICDEGEVGRGPAVGQGHHKGQGAVSRPREIKASEWLAEGNREQAQRCADSSQDTERTAAKAKAEHNMERVHSQGNCKAATANGEGGHDALGAEVRVSCQQSAAKAPTAKALHRLLEQQQYKCALSGRELTPDNASLDHRVPRVESQDESIDNLWWVHQEINTAKGTMSTEAFIAMCLAVAGWVCKGKLPGPCQPG
jgi:5-methylcytosine-specific restriction endonuclease McrA